MSQLTTPTYPAAARSDVVDILHGVRVPDPYRWLEVSDAADTKAFVDSQNECYEKTTEVLGPLRDKFNARMTELFNYPKFTCYRREGDRLIYELNSGLQQQSVLYTQFGTDDPPEVLLDPNSFSDDGTIALSGKAFSTDGGIMSYAVSKSGSDWVTIKFMELVGKTTLPDELHRVKFSCQAWYKNEGIFYNRYLESESAQDGTETETNTNQKLYYHKLGTSQSEDVLVWENPAEPEWMSSSEVTDDDRYLVLYLTHGCRPENLVWVVDLETTPIATIAGAWAKPIDSWVGQFDYIANDGADFVFTTTHSAPLKRVVRIPEFNKPAATDPSSWTELIPEKPEMIEFAKAVASDLVAVEYIKDVKSQLAVFKLVDGSHVRDIPIPVGTVAGFSGKRKLSEVFFKFTSFLEPGAVYQLADFADDSAPPKLIKTTELPGGLDLSMFETKQVFYPSKDGTKIPMFIVSRAGLQQDESNPTLLYGYGGFNISLTPSFSVSRLIWCQHFGGILCVANIRGGGEYGLSWHDAGKCENKQNCFTDFVAAAQYLVAEKYTKPERIAIQGGSNGGLLVCACANQAPTEIRAVVAQVGVLDILRFHKFTIGHAWTSDFGNPDVEKDFGVAKAYSPLHNVVVPPSDGSWQYPSMMLLTADHDDRVSPLHSLKHIAELQHTAGSSTGQTNPLLIKVDTKSGHGAGKPTSKRIEEAAHVYAFIADATGATWKS